MKKVLKHGSIVIEFSYSDPGRAWDFVDDLEGTADDVGPLKDGIKLTRVVKTVPR